MRRAVIALFTLALAQATVVSAQTVTTRDIVELSKAGLAEEVLLALIDVHRPVFPIDTETLKGLKEAGVPRAVIIAMIKSGREQTPQPEPVVHPVEPAPPVAPAPVVVIEHHYEEPRVREVAVPVAVPVYVPVRQRPIVRPKPVEPVYWGHGGKLRPDAWKPAGLTVQDVQKDAKVPKVPQKK